MVKPYYTKIMIHPLFIVNMIRQLYVFCNHTGYHRSGKIHISSQDVHYFSRVETVFWIFPQRVILCTTAEQ